MDRVRSLFKPRRKPPSIRGSQLQAQAYDAVQEQEAPIMGSMPVTGNGPTLEQLHLGNKRKSTQIRRQSTETTAFTFAGRRERRDSYGPRPNTAPSKGRTRSGFSTKSPPDFLVGLEKQPEPPMPKFIPQGVGDRAQSMTNSLRPPRSLAGAQAGTAHNRVNSSYIDLFDAVSVFSPELEKSSRHKTVASGKRDYGEDVADRNIMDFGSGDINLNSPQYSYLKNFYAREHKTQHASSSRTRNRNDDKPFHTKRNDDNSDSRLSMTATNASRSHDHASQLANSSPAPTRPLISSAAPRTSSLTSATSAPITKPKPPFTQSQRTSSLTSTTSRDFHYPTNSDRARSRSLARHVAVNPGIASSSEPATSRTPPLPASAPVTNTVPQEVIAPLQSRRASVASTKSYIPSRGQGDTYIPSGSTSHDRQPSTTSVRSRKRSTPTASIEPSRGLVDSPTVPNFPAYNKIPSSNLNKVVSYKPTPPLPPIDIRHLQSRGNSPLPTPPMSPSAQTTSYNGNIPNRRSSLETKLQGHTRSRGSSASYSIFPPQAGSSSFLQKRSSQTSNASSLADSGDGIAESKTGTANQYSNEKRNGLILDKSPGAPGAHSLEGIVDLTNSIDTDRTVTQAPAVIHEFVQPIVHHITEERITREIHTHDVFHRILPVIDVEILPTKHYIPDPHRAGALLEIPESMVPARHGNWQISVSSQIASAGAVASNAVNLFHRAHESQEPVLSSKKTYITKEGYPKTEYVWRHPPVLEPAAYAPGATMPMHMNCLQKGEVSGRTGEAIRNDDLRNEHDHRDSGVSSGLNEKDLLASLNGAAQVPSQSGLPSNGQSREKIVAADIEQPMQKLNIQERGSHSIR